MNEREAEADGPIRQITTAVWANVFGFTVCVRLFISGSFFGVESPQLPVG